MMKRITIISTLLLSLCLTTGLQAQDIHTGWRQKTIAVENGGESPTVIQLLKAFNKVWHYKSTDALLAEAGDKLYVSNDATEGNSGRAFVDCEDFCHCWYDFEDSDYHMVEARTYQCVNGHLLFAVILAEAGPRGKYFCRGASISAASMITTPRRQNSRQRMSRLLISVPSGQAHTSPTPSAKAICR